MAHVYLMTRGIKHQVDNFITELSMTKLPYRTNNPLKPNETMLLQTSVRPIQLWEIVYPKEHRDAMLNTLCNGGTGSTQHSKHQKFIWALRKALGVDKVPEDYKRDQIIPLVFDQHIEKIVIGVKDDGNFTGPEYI